MQFRVGNPIVSAKAMDMDNPEPIIVKPILPAVVTITDKQNDFTGNRKAILNRLQNLGKCAVVAQTQAVAE